MTTSIIYFDVEDEDIDGMGWNTVEYGGTIAARFPTLMDAINITMSWGHNFVVVSKDLTLLDGANELNRYLTC